MPRKKQATVAIQIAYVVNQWRRGILLFTACLVVGGAHGEGAVRLMPQWIPQAQFAGYYVAQEKGFYAAQSIEAEVLEGGPDRPAAESLASGVAEFATMFLAEALAARERGIPVVNIAQLTQRSALMLVARKSSGIRGPKDLAGRKVSLWRDFETQPKSLFHKLGIEVRIVPQTSSLNLFLRGGVDAASAMWYNEYHLLLNAGLEADELTVMFFDAQGLNFPEDGIYCLETTLEKDRELCCRFVAASIAGWRYAFSHQEEALEIVMRRTQAAHTGTNRSHQAWMLAHLRDLILPDDATHPMGRLNPADFKTATEELKRCGAITEAPTLEKFYVDCSQEK